MGFQWPFRHLIASGVPEAGALRRGASTTKPIIAQTGNLATKKKSHLEHAIASRRASDFVQIAITLKIPQSNTSLCPIRWNSPNAVRKVESKLLQLNGPARKQMAHSGLVSRFEREPVAGLVFLRLLLQRHNRFS
jgi:hypothetical protein